MVAVGVVVWSIILNVGDLFGILFLAFVRDACSVWTQFIVSFGKRQ